MINFARGLIAASLTGALAATAPPATADPTPDPLQSVPLRQAIDELPVAPEDRTGYQRSRFRHWTDEDGDSCSTRAEVLIAEAVHAPQVGPGCALTGGRWLSYYDDVHVDSARKLDVDHMVPLAEAWDSGASQWTAERREQYANDLDFERSLVAVTARSNRSKADRDPAQWWVPSPQASCTYLADWVATKTRWRLSVDQAELAALNERAATCPDVVLTVPIAN
ncbi:HNH endonuclease family protein [Streptomyces chumphonensis]